MTSTLERPPVPPGALLVRVPVDGPSWARRLPPVPAGASLTVTVSAASLGRVPADDLVSSGYRVAGVVEPARLDETSSIHVLVPRSVQQEHPDWFRSLLRAADRALPCDLGPVRHRYAGTLRRHAQARGSGTP